VATTARRRSDRAICFDVILPALLPVVVTEAGVDVRFADLPMIEGATGKFLLQQMAAVAELEAGMISARTKAALAAAKRRGVKLGGDRGARLTAKARAAGRAAVQERVRNRALDLAPTIQELQGRRVCVTAGHCSRVGGAGHSCGARRQVGIALLVAS
jgi:DNA invertase Pin-like site-specific DNA recombinase